MFPSFARGLSVLVRGNDTRTVIGDMAKGVAQNEKPLVGPGASWLVSGTLSLSRVGTEESDRAQIHNTGTEPIQMTVVGGP